MIPTPYHAYFPTLKDRWHQIFHDVQVSNIKSISHVNARFKRGDEDSCIVLNVGVLAQSHQPSLQQQETSAFNLLVFKILLWFCMRGFGGGGGVPGPLDLSEVGSCMDVWWVWEGVLRWFILLLPFFFRFVSPASNIHRVNILQILITSKYKGKGTVNPYITQITIPDFHESAFPLLFGLKVQYLTPYKPKLILLGDPLDPYINNTFILHC